MEMIDGKEYLTVEEAATRLGINYETCKKRIQRGKLRAIKRPIEGPPGWCWMVEITEQGAGRTETEAPSAECPVLSEDVARGSGLVAREEEAAHGGALGSGLAAREEEAEPEVEVLPALPQAQGVLELLQVPGKELALRELSPLETGLRAWQQHQALLRYDLLAAYSEACAGGRKGALDFLQGYNAGILLPELYREIGRVSRKTLKKWRHKLIRHGNDPLCLAPRWGEHLRGMRGVSGPVFAYVLLYCLQPSRPPIAEAIRIARQKMLQERVPCAVSDATIRRSVYVWRNRHYDRWVFCREGDKALNDKVLPYIERDADILEVGDVLVVDGHTLNFTVLNPYTGKPGRPVLLMIFDWKSRMAAGWHIMMTENIQCVHAALRRAILALGKIPKYMFLDNGKAFRARFFTGTKDFRQTGIDGLYARLGIKAVFAKPYNAQAKPVERFFGTFAELERMIPTYTGTSIEQKPAYLLRNETIHKRLQQSRGFMPTITQADAAVAAWVEQCYSVRPHRGLGGRTPKEVWEAGRGSGIDEESLWFLMLCETRRRVSRNGVSLFGSHYWSEELYGWCEPVNVRYDIHDLDEVYVYTEDDSRIIARACRVEKLHPMAQMTGNPLDLQAVKEANKAKARLRKQTVGDLKQLADHLAGYQLAEPRELSAEEAAEIERQARQTQVIDMSRPDLPKRSGLYFTLEERYLELVEIRASGQPLTDEEERAWAEFEASEDYLSAQKYFENIKRTAQEKWASSGASDSWLVTRGS